MSLHTTYICITNNELYSKIFPQCPCCLICVSGLKLWLSGVRNLVLLRALLLWDVTQLQLVVSYWHFGTTHWSHLQGSSNLGTSQKSEDLIYMATSAWNLARASASMHIITIITWQIGAPWSRVTLVWVWRAVTCTVATVTITVAHFVTCVL
jgi:hypothetical protein